MLSKIGEAFKHSEDVIVRIEVEDADTGLSLSEEYYCNSGNINDILEGVEEVSANIVDKISTEFNA